MPDPAAPKIPDPGQLCAAHTPNFPALFANGAFTWPFKDAPGSPFQAGLLFR
jgi:hypothetical protein